MLIITFLARRRELIAPHATIPAIAPALEVVAHPDFLVIGVIEQGARRCGPALFWVDWALDLATPWLLRGAGLLIQGLPPLQLCFALEMLKHLETVLLSL